MAVPALTRIVPPLEKDWLVLATSGVAVVACRSTFAAASSTMKPAGLPVTSTRPNTMVMVPGCVASPVAFSDTVPPGAVGSAGRAFSWFFTVMVRAVTSSFDVPASNWPLNTTSRLPMSNTQPHGGGGGEAAIVKSETTLHAPVPNGGLQMRWLFCAAASLCVSGSAQAIEIAIACAGDAKASDPTAAPSTSATATDRADGTIS